MGCCGPGGTKYKWLNWLLDCLVPDRPFWIVSFGFCCRVHDEAYTNPENRTRQDIDIEFLACMLRRSDMFSFFRRYPARILAGIYYTRVMLYGSRAWKRARANDSKNK